MTDVENRLVVAADCGLGQSHESLFVSDQLFVATLRSGVDFGDKEPVDIIFLFVTPVAASNTHLKSHSSQRRLSLDGLSSW